MANDLDELMSRDPCDLSSADIDAIIAYHRAQRARRASGERPTKPKSTGIDISEIRAKLISETAPAPTITRRKL